MFDGDVFQTVARDNHAALLRQAADDALAHHVASEPTPPTSVRRPTQGGLADVLRRILNPRILAGVRHRPRSA
jgi:hypothetical protein